MLCILECANNHDGSLDRGIEIVEAFAPLIGEFPSLQLAMKFQYRDKSILRLGYETGMTRRIASTMLSETGRAILAGRACQAGFDVGCTPFDETSCDLVMRHGYSFVKVASASLTDWPLLERVVTLGMPVIASTGGSDMQDVEHAAQFLGRRAPLLTLLHCVAMYPTDFGSLGMDRIDELRRLGYPVGFSTHEDPESDWGVLAAVAKGAEVLEWHVSIPPLNSYSLTVDQCRRRLQAVQTIMKVCRPTCNSCEDEQLQSLRRGMWATKDISEGELLTTANTVLQMPAQTWQVLANDLSKYTTWRAAVPIRAGDRVYDAHVNVLDTRNRVQTLADMLLKTLSDAHVTLPRPAKLILSHHNGLDSFERIGCGMVEVVSTDKYCKKLIVLLPGQRHPAHKHLQKTETFNVVSGLVDFVIGGICYRSDQCGPVTVTPGEMHSFSTTIGAVIEEVSTASLAGDSEYLEPVDGNRKTEVFVL